MSAGRERSIQSATQKDVAPSIPSASQETQSKNKKLEGLVKRTLKSWDSLSPEAQQKKSESVTAAIVGHRDVDRVTAASALISLKEGIYQSEVERNGGSEFGVAKPSYLKELSKILKPSDFHKVGKAVQDLDGVEYEDFDEDDKLITRRPDKYDYVSEARTEIGVQEESQQYLPRNVVEKIIDCYTEAGFLRESKRGKGPNETTYVGLTNKGKQSRLDYSSLSSIVRANGVLERAGRKTRDLQTTDDITARYDLYAEENKVDEVGITVSRDSGKVAYLSKILLGNSASDTKFLDKTLEQFGQDKPDAIVVTGLMEGGHKNTTKNQREGLVQGLNEQYRDAKIYLDRLRALDIPIVVSMSGEDRAIAREGTLITLNSLRKASGHLSDTKKGHITYWQGDQMMRDDEYDAILKFQREVVHPYSMLSGRRLRSADEVYALTTRELPAGHHVKVEEFVLLEEAYNALLRGEDLTDEQKVVLDVDNIPLPGKKFGNLEFVDDANLTVTTKGQKRGEKNETDYMVRDNLNLTDVTLPQNPIAVPHAISRQMASEGMDVPNALVVTGQQLMVGVGGPDGSWVMSTGGMLDSTRPLNQKGSKRRAGSSPQLRQTATRRLLAKPSSETHEFTDDGRHIITIFNEKLMEKSFAVPDRRTILIWNDWQNGSTTARPDLQQKYISIGNELMKDRLVYIDVNGDIQHGDIYGKHKTENAHMGLIAASAQQAFNLFMLERGMDHLSGDQLQNIVKFMSVPGNHEYENGNRDNSDVPNQYLVNDMKERFRRNGIDPEGRVGGYGSFQTGRGDFLKAWTGVEKDIAGYGVVFKHKLLEKGAKGQGGIPVFQSRAVFEGLGTFAKDIDLGIHGHWHHPQYGLFGDKLAVVSAAMAGWSGFEMDLGYQSVVGGTLIHLGGGKPPQVEFLSAKALHQHKITEGYFSDKNLRAEGFRTDREFDPGKHGYAQNRTAKETRMSALQKALWTMQDEVVWQADSKL